MNNGKDIFTCPECKEEYVDFDDMMVCYKEHLED